MTIFIKLGGSVITEKSKPLTVRIKVIKRLIEEIRQAQIQNPDIQLVIGHGSGSFGHFAAQKYTLPYTPEQIQEIHNAAHKLHQIVLKELQNVKLNVLSVSLKTILEGKISTDNTTIPLVFGDILDDGMIYSTEMIFEHMVPFFAPKKMVMVTDTDGIFGKEKYDHITKENSEEVTQYLKITENDVTGGIEHKVKFALAFADQGIATLIINGNQPGNLLKALTEREVLGTIIS